MTDSRSQPMSTTAEFHVWKADARRDDWHTRFVGSDIRRMLSEIERLSNSHAALVKALEEILEANDDFRKGMPEGWEGDPLQDACNNARELILPHRSAKT